MDSEPKDFKAVKVQMKSSQKSGEQLSRSMLYSGINIFGQLSQIYLQTKESGGSYQTFSESIGGGKGLQSAESGDSGSMMNLNQEILAIFKRLQKKDSTTKIKAFQELERYVDSLEISNSSLLNQSMQSEDISGSQSQQDEMQSLLTFFLYHFCRIIMNEPDKKVREAAHLTLAVFIKKAKRRLGPHLKRIFSLWFCSFFDISPEVSILARKNFENAFPQNKRDQVFKISYKNFLHFANEQLKQSEENISESVADLSKAQREDVFDRITSSVLQALAKSFEFTKDWEEEERDHFKKKIIDILDLSAPIPTQEAVEEKKGAGKKQQHQSYLWGFLQPKYRGRVRASCLMFISNLMINLPKDVIESHISQLAPLVHGLIGEDNSQLQTTLWRDALFTLGKTYQSSWESTNIKKNFLPKLYSALKASAFGSPTALYENFVKFVSIFPFYHLIDYTEDKQNKASLKERCNLIRETLTTLYQGLKNDESVAYHQDLLKSYFETFAFLVLKRVQPLIQNDKPSQEDKDFAITQLKKCIQLPLEDYINNYEKFNSKVQNQRNIRSTIPAQMAKMFKDLAERNLDQKIFSSIIEFMNESINLNVDKPNIIRVFNGVLRDQFDSQSSYFNDFIISRFIMNYVQQLQQKVTGETENLGKDNIDSLIIKTQLLFKTLYKLNKFNINITDKLNEPSLQLQAVFNKIQKKEEMAKNVLSQDLLTKFKIIKENIIKSIILCTNAQKQSPEFNSFIQSLLSQKQIEITLKVKLLLPTSDLKKIDFTNYYTRLNLPEIHESIMLFVIQLIQDSHSITQNYQVIDTGLQLIKESGNSSFILAQDKNIIAEEVLQVFKAAKPTDFVILQPYLNLVKSLLISPDAQNFIALRELLFEKLLQINTSNPAFSALWSIYSQTIKVHLNIQGTNQKSDYFKNCVQRLKQELQGIYSQNGIQTSSQIDTINRFTLIVKQFVQLLPAQGSDRQEVIEDILLQEKAFTSNLENNCLPLKMFRDLFLSGGLGGFDITKLLGENKYVWLASVLLNGRHLPSLANFVDMKKQIIIFVDTELIPALINQAQIGNSQFILEIFQYMANRASTHIDFVYSIEYFIKKMIDPGEEFPADEKPILKIDEFKAIFHIVKKDIVQKVINNENVNYTNDVLLFLRVLKDIAYYIMDEDDLKKLYKSTVEELKSTIGQSISQVNQKISIILEIYQALHQYLNGQSEGDLSQKILINILQQQNTADSNILNSILKFASYILEQSGVTSFINQVKGKVKFQGFLTWIMEMVKSEELQPLTYIHLVSMIRKTINSEELINDRPLMVQQVIQLSKEKSMKFNRKIQKIQELIKQSFNHEETKSSKKKHVMFEQIEEESKLQENQQLSEQDQIEDFEYEMLQEAAETLIALTNFVTPSINENDLYLLINSGVESLQKAAFILLKYLYENYIPIIKFKIDESDMLKQIKQEAIESEEQPTEEIKGNEDHEKIKNKLAFRNISDTLIDIIENPPAINADGTVYQQQVISGSTQVESLIFQDTHNQSQQQINCKVFGYLLAWNAVLTKIEQGRIKAQLQGDPEYAQVLGALNEYLEENDGIYRLLLVNLLAYLPEEKRGLSEAYNVSSFMPEYMDLGDKKAASLLTVYTLINFMKSFPSLARKYYQECDKQLLDLVMPYIKQIVSPAILENEIKKIEVAQSQLGQSELTFSLFKSTKEILANFSKGEIEMTLKIKIPVDYPLKLVEVDVSRQIKISEKQLRKWILAIRKIIQFQNGDIITAVLAWKSNIEREIEGIEDCYICYCVVHENDQSLPKMPCKTCKNKFHVACIRKWFRKSHKSNCPICQNYFF